MRMSNWRWVQSGGSEATIRLKSPASATPANFSVLVAPARVYCEGLVEERPEERDLSVGDVEQGSDRRTERGNAVARPPAPPAGHPKSPPPQAADLPPLHLAPAGP